MEPMYTVKEVAEMLKLSENGVRLAISVGRLRAYKVSSRWMVAESDLKDFIFGESNLDREEVE